MDKSKVPRMKSIFLNLPEDTYEELKHIAFDLSLPVNDIIRHIVCAQVQDFLYLNGK